MFLLLAEVEDGAVAIRVLALQEDARRAEAAEEGASIRRPGGLTLITGAGEAAESPEEAAEGSEEAEEEGRPPITTHTTDLLLPVAYSKYEKKRTK